MRTLGEVQQYLDDRLLIGRYADRSGNGLLVRGRPEVRRIGAALNTSFAAISAAERAGVDLLFVALVESQWVRGGGLAPIQHGFGERAT